MFSIIMVISPVFPRQCNGPVRPAKLFNEHSRGYVRVENGMVIANESEAAELLMITTDINGFLLFDTRKKMFICWTKSYSNLKPRKNPVNLEHCKFKEVVSKNYDGSHTNYVSSYKPGVNIKFNRRGRYARKSFLEKCEKKRHTRHQKSECSSADFLLNPESNSSCETLHKNFCAHIQRLRKVVRELSKFCKIEELITNDTINIH